MYKARLIYSFYSCLANQIMYCCIQEIWIDSVSWIFKRDKQLLLRLERLLSKLQHCVV